MHTAHSSHTGHSTYALWFYSYLFSYVSDSDSDQFSLLWLLLLCITLRWKRTATKQWPNNDTSSCSLLTEQKHILCGAQRRNEMTNKCARDGGWRIGEMDMDMWNVLDIFPSIQFHPIHPAEESSPKSMSLRNFRREKREQKHSHTRRMRRIWRMTSSSSSRNDDAVLLSICCSLVCNNNNNYLQLPCRIFVIVAIIAVAGRPQHAANERTNEHIVSFSTFSQHQHFSIIIVRLMVNNIAAKWVHAK